MAVWVNRLVGEPHPAAICCGTGWIVPKDQAVLSVADRGFLLGDGLFETVLVRSGWAPFLALHQSRHENGCQVLDLPPSPSFEPVLRGLLEHTGYRDAVMRITTTRGPGARGYRIPQPSAPFTAVSLSDLPPPTPSPWRLAIADHPVLPHPVLCRVKHTSALERIVAIREAEDRGADDILLCTPDHIVLEGTATNILWRIGDAIYTPHPVSAGCLPGVGRHMVIRWARAEGFTVHEGRFSLSDLERAEEVLVTNAIRGPIPVAEVMGVGQWESPGPLTQRAMDAWEEWVL